MRAVCRAEKGRCHGMNGKMVEGLVSDVQCCAAVGMLV